MEDLNVYAKRLWKHEVTDFNRALKSKSKVLYSIMLATKHFYTDLSRIYRMCIRNEQLLKTQEAILRRGKASSE